MIVDFHCHNFPQGVAVRAMREMCRMTEGVLWPAGDGTLEGHLDAMESAGVDLGVVCQIATKPKQWEFILRRSEAIISGELGDRARRMLVPFASVHPHDEQFAAHLEVFASAGIKGVKFHPYYQGFSLSDPSVWPIFRKIAELGLLVECHAGEDVSWRNERGYCGPCDIVRLVKNCRGLKFVAAHLGGCRGYDAHATDEMLECGVYIDTSSLALRWSYDEEMRILRSWPTDRILFGTDFPWVHYPEAIANVKSIRSRSDWSAVFADNALRLLGVSMRGAEI